MEERPAEAMEHSARRGSSGRREALSFAISLLVHAALLLLVVTLVVPAVNGSRPRRGTAAIAVEMRSVPHVPREKKIATETAPTPPPPVRRGKRSRGEYQPLTVKPPASSPEPDRPLAQPPSGGSFAPFASEDRPARIPDLRAGLPTLKPGGELPGGGSPWGGTTVYPGSEPDHATAMRESKRRAQEVIDGAIAQTRELEARRRVDIGVVDDYFRGMRHALEKSAAHPQPFGNPSFGSSVVSNYLSAAKNYAKSGNPNPGQTDPLYPETDPKTQKELEALARRMSPTPLGDTAMLGPQNTGGMPYPGVASLGAIVNDELEKGLVALVEIRQAVDGKLIKSILVKSSGNNDFDAHVMKSAPDALADLSAPPPDGQGIHPEGIRSLWAFQGKVSYRKSAKDVGAKDLGSVAAGVIPSLLGGVPFDETTGDVYVLDPAHPSFVVKVKLIAVY